MEKQDNGESGQGIQQEMTVGQKAVLDALNEFEEDEAEVNALATNETREMTDEERKAGEEFLRWFADKKEQEIPAPIRPLRRYSNCFGRNPRGRGKGL